MRKILVLVVLALSIATAPAFACGCKMTPAQKARQEKAYNDYRNNLIKNADKNFEKCLKKGVKRETCEFVRKFEKNGGGLTTAD